VFLLACLQNDALQALDAIGRAMLRMMITRRKLLEWRTARDAQRTAQLGVIRSLAAMWIGPVLAVVAVVYLDLGDLAAAAPLVALWTIAPVWSWWSSLPIAPRQARLAASDRRFLRTVARRTWRFFDTHVAIGDHFLPPDNVQDDPPRGAAHRTSPTNIGMSLVANLAAYDFGYVSAGDLLMRTTRTLAALDRLQRYRGHFYNWYDTATLEPLRPMYVSTVDSGNLAGHLLTLAGGLDELADRPACPTLAGLGDTLDLVAELAATWPEVTRELAHLRSELRAVPATTAETYAELRRLVPRAHELVRMVTARGDAGRTAPGSADPRRGPSRGQDDVQGAAEAAWWARAFEAQVVQLHGELVALAPWVALPRDGDPASWVILDGPLTRDRSPRGEGPRHRSRRARRGGSRRRARGRAARRAARARSALPRVRGPRLRAALRSIAAAPGDRLQRRRSPARRELL
jgi:cyclic beta-1,2-glucan synthetase